MRVFVLSMAALALAACARNAETPAPEAAAQVQLYAMDCGRGRFSDLAMFSDEHAYDGVAGELIVPCYLIRHPAGDLIWDTGLPEALADAPPAAADAPEQFSVPVKLTAQLAQLGLTPADIEFVSISHSHSDHSGNLNLFTHSTWIVDADERAYMFDARHRADPNDFGNYAQMENAETKLIEGDGDYDVFGDGSVTIIQTPGHTPGHTILRVNLANAGPILLTGDMYHLAESRERRTVPVFNFDRVQTLASMDKVEALAASIHARVIRQHVIEDFETLPSFPEALN